MTATDKLRAIISWADDMDEHFNDKVKSVADWVILYDLSYKYNIGYIDYESSDDDIYDKFMKEANELLGYQLYKF